MTPLCRQPAMSAITYRISPRPAHRLHIRLEVELQTAQLHCYLPVWIPGSYTRRDFSRLLSILKIENQGQALDWRLDGLSAWSAVGRPGAWAVEYEIYARDDSVRGCYLDDLRAMFNPACACLALHGLEHLPQRLIWQPDAARRDWQSAGAQPVAEHTWQFEDYQSLIDAPLLFARDLHRAQFDAGGIAHQIAVCGAAEAADFLPRLTADVEAVCRSAIAQFGRQPETLSRYDFLLFLSDKGYDGLEHQSSSLLMAARSAMNCSDSAYIQVLGLFAHEYFHLWNVKSLRPRAYAAGYQLEREQPSDMLWLFEGFTAYFDNLLLLRSARINAAQYLNLLSADISRHLQRFGRRRQSLVHASLEAWTKLYNGGENAANISTNYYVHGALAAWCIDAYLRLHATCGLDSLLRELWENPVLRAQGLDEAAFLQQAQARLPADKHADFADFFRRLLHRCDFLPLEWAAETLGLELSLLSAAAPQENVQGAGGARALSEAGLRWQERGGHFFVRLNNPDSAAAAAGIAANDEIIAINGHSPTSSLLWQQLMCGPSGHTVHMRICRDGLHRDYRWTLSPALRDNALLAINGAAPSAAQARRRNWLNHS